MVSSDEGQRVFHLRNGAWHPIAWEDWIKFCSQDNRWAPLPDVTAGEHYFVVCILEDGRLFNILPHRYLVGREGRIANDRYFGVLSISEIEQFEELNRRHYEYPQTHPLTKSEQQMFDAFRELSFGLQY